jgi:DNA helicase HerA-like ATPase
MTKSTNNPNEPVENLAIGKLIEVDGTHVIAELDPNIKELSRVFGGETYPIGQFGSIVKIHFGRKIIYGYVGRLRMKAEYEKERGIVSSPGPDSRIVEADIFGEGEWKYNTQKEPPEWELDFERGVSTFPLPQQTIYLTPTKELKFIYGHGKGATIIIGEHVGSGGTQCHAELNELLGKHTAVLGSTGAGKSGTVAAVIHSLLEKGKHEEYEKWNPRIIVLDPHNEYGKAFSENIRLSTDEGSLLLPYWLLNLHETFSLIIGKTEFQATSQMNIIKKALLSARTDGAISLSLDHNKINVDSPVPYKLKKLEEEINNDKPSQASKQESHNSILNKITILKDDARMKFLMDEWSGEEDDFVNVVSQFIGIKKPVQIIDLSGVPNEVAGIASSVIARTLFNYKVWQTREERESDPILLVCEEAHRYVPNIGEAQYEAAQAAIRRIAKEGRKYGLGLILVSQRPSEVEATVLSQCNSWIVLRLSNERDREHVKSILPDSLAELTKVLSGLRRREAIFVGQAVMLPSRILVRKLERTQLPRSYDIDFDKGWQFEPTKEDLILEIGNRWRYQKRE